MTMHASWTQTATDEPPARRASRPRRAILATATRLFGEEGIQAVGIDRIVTEADVAPMTLYRHFDGKDALVAAALEQWSAQWLDGLYDRVERCGDDPQARLDALWDALEEWLAAGGRRGSFVTNAAAELRSRPDHPAREAVTAHRVALRQLLEGIAKQAGAHDPAGLAGQLQVLVDGCMAAATVDQHATVDPGVRALAAAALKAGSA